MLTLDLSGSGNIHGFNLTSKAASVTLGGSGNSEVHATESLKATIRGSGNIDYKGHPAHVDRAVTGSGNIRAQ